jgi:hypothetical protein
MLKELKLVSGKSNMGQTEVRTRINYALITRSGGIKILIEI